MVLESNTSFHTSFRDYRTFSWKWCSKCQGRRCLQSSVGTAWHISLSQGGGDIEEPSPGGGGALPIRPRIPDERQFPWKVSGKFGKC